MGCKLHPRCIRKTQKFLRVSSDAEISGNSRHECVPASVAGRQSLNMYSIDRSDIKLHYNLSFVCIMDEKDYHSLQQLAMQCLHHYISLFAAILTGTSSLLLSLSEREPYHTSILTGQGWVMELLDGHLK